MKPAGDGLARMFQSEPGACCYPGCTEPRVPSSSANGPFMCGKHADLYTAAVRARLAAEQAVERELPRRFITDRLNGVIPLRYRDVIAPPSEDDPEFAERAVVLALLKKRIRVRPEHFADVLRSAMSAAEHLRRERGAVVLFTGLSGAGKSTLMAFVLRVLARDIPREKFAKNRDFMPGGLFGEEWEGNDENPYVGWTSSYDLFDAAKADDLRVFNEAPLLAIDDIGNEPDQVNVRAVSHVVWKRHDAMRSTILTTGFINEHAPPEDREAHLAPLAARYGSAFVRRLGQPDDPHCMVIHLPR